MNTRKVQNIIDQIKSKDSGLNEDEKDLLIRELLVERLRCRGFPVAYLRSEADSSFGVYIENETTIIPLDYAIGMIEEENIKHIRELSISILAELLDHGIYKTDRDWEYMEQEKEDSLKAAKKIQQVEES